jgi:TolB protein
MRRLLLGTGLLAILAAGPATSAAPSAAGPRRVSEPAAGGDGDGLSFNPALSANGRFVAFASSSTNLVAGDDNSVPDVFVRGVRRGELRLVSTSIDGGPANGPSGSPSLSADGRWIAFVSYAGDLVPQGPPKDGVARVYLRDLKTGEITLVSRGRSDVPSDSDSFDPCVSGNGRFVAFASYAGNLVGGDGNFSGDVFVFDRRTKAIERISEAAAGGDAAADSGFPTISFDGRYVAFESWAANLVTGDGNAVTDVFRRDRRLGTTTRVSAAPGGGDADVDSYSARISADGRRVAFTSYASNLSARDGNGTSDVYVWNAKTGATTLASVNPAGDAAGGDSGPGVLSPDGRFLVFVSSAVDVDPAYPTSAADVFVRDLTRGRTWRASLVTRSLDGPAVEPCASTRAAVIAFGSFATNLAEGDKNSGEDIFVLR